MTLWAKRTDGNHADIRQAMRDAGADVEDMSGAGRGFPDTVVRTRDDRVLLVEIKTPTGKLTPAQVKFHQRFPVHIVRTVEEAVELVTDPDHDSHDETTYNELP
jgi:hypothetical protein